MPGLMGMNNLFSYLWISVFIMLIFCTIAAGSDTPEIEHNTLFQNMSDNLLSSDDSRILLSAVLDRNSELQTAIIAADSKTGPPVRTEGTGWHDVTMPAVISEPGQYRVVNDYTGVGEQIGLLINCSDVYVDGNGHTFSGSYENYCYGVVAANDYEISNITVTNFNSRRCTIGVAYLGVLAGEIINTTHYTNTGGISVGNGGSIHITHNTISGYDSENPSTEIFGIAGTDVSDLIIEENQISDFGSSVYALNSIGMMFSNAHNSTVRNNTMSGPLAVGLNIENTDVEDSLYSNIYNNRISGADSLGLSISNGLFRVANNTVFSGKNGILVTADDSFITQNIIRDNAGNGLSIHGRNLTIRENILTNNTYNFYIDGLETEDFLHTIDRTNLCNGRPLIYIRESEGDLIGKTDNPAMVLAVNSRNLTVRDVSTGSNVAGIFLVNSTGSHVSHATDSGSITGSVALRSNNCSISDLIVSANKGYGVTLFETSNITFNRLDVSGSSNTGILVQVSRDTRINNSSVGNFNPETHEDDASGIEISESHGIVINDSEFSNGPYYGVFVANCKNVSVQNTKIMGNKESGVYFIQDSFVSVDNSDILDNEDCGISMDFISNFTLNRNFVTGNKKSGVMFLDVKDGIIADNLFNNSENVIFVYEKTPLVWNTTLTQGENIAGGPYLGGNFWANLNGSGFSQTHADRGDGICNASYRIATENMDYLPLAVPSDDIIPDFIAGPISGTPPLSVKFTDNSTGYPKAWNWTFGDGTFSSEQNPIHIYSGIGRYSVILEVTGRDGKQGITQKQGFIDVNAGRYIGPNGMLFVNSTPQNASIYLDNLFIGLSPLKAIGISAGQHTIMISHEGYQNRTDSIWVKCNEMTYVPAIPLRKK
ncbi:NosD domain-containing protein [Methanospirillum stamsii]|uniref:PKD domain-containing protein n=1 Tax=Methanospirillum stamsii TaxID=1277351 RepID=A0A2V2NHP4_9EURY|nr:NosD domain-containing protein [Methanospirillum stamsii]PWR75898.1 hypothetical protein DLD82_02205 [Methanospirillum stamsii]